MENKDIILIILIIIVLYLLFCDNRKNKEIKKVKEQLSERFSNENITITESIKNLGLIAAKLQEDGNITIPGNVKIQGSLSVDRNFDANNITSRNTGNIPTLRVSDIQDFNYNNRIAIDNTSIRINGSEINMNGNLNVNSNLNVDGNLNVDETASFKNSALDQLSINELSVGSIKGLNDNQYLVDFTKSKPIFKGSNTYFFPDEDTTGNVITNFQEMGSLARNSLNYGWFFNTQFNSQIF